MLLIGELDLKQKINILYNFVFQISKNSGYYLTISMKKREERIKIK